MIRLTRARTTAIPAGLRGAARVAKNAELLKQHSAGNGFEFRSTYWKPGKKQLRVESSGKCAYCEGPTEVVAHGDVEHFRPKAIYWWLAYCYDNHLFACQICNQSFKGDRFPIFGSRMGPPELADDCGPDPLDDRSGLTRSQFLEAAAREAAGLIDPYAEDPEPYFCWVADAVQKEVVCRAASGASPRGLKVFQCCEELLGLNREELRKWRYRTYERLELLVACLEEDLTPRTRARILQQIERMASPHSEFAGMVRYFVRAWRVPQP